MGKSPSGRVPMPRGRAVAGLRGPRRVSRPGVPRVKVAVPSLPAGLVSRPGLLAALEATGGAAVTLVCAPAGSGKTLLLAEWVRRGEGVETAWVSLDEGDNDDHRFWSGVLEAVAGCAVVPEGSWLRSVRVPARPSHDPDFLAGVVEGLAAS